MWSIRPVREEDASTIAGLLDLYMRETYKSQWPGSTAGLEKALSSRHIRIHVATRFDEIVGFVAWTWAFDLHWCMVGGTILDLYVHPRSRAKTLGVRLLAAAASAVRAEGGTFLKGGAVDNPAAKRLYNRCAVCQPDVDCTLSGRAFRQFADLEAAPARRLIQAMPHRSWNFEP